MLEQRILDRAFRVRADYLGNINHKSCHAALKWLKSAQLWAYQNNRKQALEIITSYLAECKNHRPGPYQPRKHRLEGRA